MVVVGTIALEACPEPLGPQRSRMAMDSSRMHTYLVDSCYSYCTGYCGWSSDCTPFCCYSAVCCHCCWCYCHYCCHCNSVCYNACTACWHHRRCLCSHRTLRSPHCPCNILLELLSPHWPLDSTPGSLPPDHLLVSIADCLIHCFPPPLRHYSSWATLLVLVSYHSSLLVAWYNLNIPFPVFIPQKTIWSIFGIIRRWYPFWFLLT